MIFRSKGPITLICIKGAGSGANIPARNDWLVVLHAGLAETQASGAA
jgi:hypothetical protein